MSEEIKIPRLGKAAKEFNVATSTIVEFLSKKEFTVEDNINTKLTLDMYQLLMVEYQYEKNIKEEAQKIEIGTSLKHAVEESKPEVEKIEKPAKSSQTSKVEKAASEIVEKEKEIPVKIATEEPVEITKEVPEKITTQDPVKIIEEIPEKIIAEDIVKITEVEPTLEQEQPQSEPEPLPKLQPEPESELEPEPESESVLEGSTPTIKTKIIGKVDLDSLNVKTRPAKKTREERQKETKAKKEQEERKRKEEQEKRKKEREKAKKEKQKARKEKAEKEKKTIEKIPSEDTKVEKPKIVEELPKKEEIKPAPTPMIVPAGELSTAESSTKKEPEMIKADVPSLKAPKVIGVLDLSTINEKTKPKKKTREELRKGQEERFRAEKELRKARKAQRDKEIARRKALQKEKDKERLKEKEKDKNKDKDKDKDKKIGKDKKVNFIATNVEKLSGVKVIDKITIPDEKKDSKSKTADRDKGGDKREKRKRIKTVASESKIPGFGDQKDFNKKKKDQKRDVRRIEISEEEVDMQIKKTMARMAPLGKTKASKHRREKRDLIQQTIEQAQERQAQERNILKVTEYITANELATMMNVPVNKVIATCMSVGLMVAINQRLDTGNIQLLAEEFGFQVQFVGIEEEEGKQEEEFDPVDLEPRSPIVTIMGHVDHGKTSLLDYIRKTNVIAGEAGGITQHIGAYEVDLPDGRSITFLDTPGHEAFTAMRARGAKVTDIVIVVIASDDSIMPQTIEAINHAQAAGVPIIFAINKIDKPGADPEKIRNALANMNLLVEEWGGKIQSQDISAKKGINVDVLLEKILIEAEMLELKANPKVHASGTIIESSLDKGRGYVAKALIQNGTLYKGDVVVAGTSCGKIKAMYNERNHLLHSAGPASPVLLLGLDSAPQAGDTFKVYENEKEAKSLVGKRQQLIREQGLRTQKHITLAEIGRRIAIGDFKELNVIVKGDVDGSIEALSDALLRLTTEEIQVNIIHKSVGQVTESDILLASASNAIIIAFQVRPSAGARKLAEQEQIDIRTYSIIYDAINDLKEAIEGMKAPEIKENIVCNIEVREVFHISKVGVIAGCYVLDGKVQRSTQIRVIRDGIVIHTGKLGSLKRFKDDVKEVTSNYECGLNIESYNDIKIGDIIEGFEQVEVKK